MKLNSFFEKVMGKKYCQIERFTFVEFLNVSHILTISPRGPAMAFSEYARRARFSARPHFDCENGDICAFGLTLSAKIINLWVLDHILGSKFIKL